MILGTAAPARAVAAPHGLRTADNGARIVSQEWLDTSTFDFTVASPAIGSDQKVRVLVPRGWSSRSARTWPVLFAFHGGRDTYVSWTRSSQIKTIANTYDVMVVMPEADNGGYADWWNYGKRGTPRWEQFHMSEVRQLVERNYRAGEVRACMGNSSGGQGCIAYAARHPGAFRYAASMSGILSLLSPGIPRLLTVTNLLNALDPFRIWGIPGVDDANWRAHDPLALAPRLRGTGLFIASGTNGLPGPLDDESTVVGGLIEAPTGTTNIEFRNRLRELGIPVTARLYGPGSHSWPYWRRELDAVWPSLMSAIGAAKTGSSA
ncbi:alpha/beta hydrolase family protein [Actinomadura vinacea]|uniref:Alpha/beta hydrolase family protein n=1 Tax=Actinomadura vinacea TaxID=115336 RepID=A0ABN3JF97_9ACTN